MITVNFHATGKEDHYCVTGNFGRECSWITIKGEQGEQVVFFFDDDKPESLLNFANRINTVVAALVEDLRARTNAPTVTNGRGEDFTC